MRHESWNCWRTFGCVYTFFFHGRIIRTFVKYVTLTWHGEFFVEAGAQSGFQLSSRASITFKVCFYDFYVVFGLSSHSDHLRIIFCFVWWQLLTVGNRDNQMYSAFTEKQASFAPLHDFFHFSRRCRTSQNDISIIHIFFCKDTKPYTKISRFFSQKKNDPEVCQTTSGGQIQRSVPSTSSCQRSGMDTKEGCEDLCSVVFFPTRKTNSTTPLGVILEIFWWTSISWEKKQFFSLMTWSMKENWKATT